MELNPLGTLSVGHEPPSSPDLSIVGKRVLLAEDDVAARHVMAAALRAMGLEVLESDDGGRMLVAVTSHYKNGRSPEDLHLVITDVCMPVVDGLDVFEAMRAARWTTPVIVVTAYDSPSVQKSVARLGAILLRKPLCLDRLERTVRELLTRAQPSTPPPGLA
jgi:two-component system OmpR family response regulator